MNEEIIKKIAEEEFINNTMKHLDSALIFVYIKNLEKEYDDYKSRIDKAIEKISSISFQVSGLKNISVALFIKLADIPSGKDLLNILQGSNDNDN